MQNMKSSLINQSDYEMISIMAKKYNMSVEDFGRILSKKVEKDIRHQIRFSTDEVKLIDARAEKLNMTRSEYCRRCYMKAIDEKLFADMNIRDLKTNMCSSQTARDVRVALSFDDAEKYKEMRKLAKDLSMHFSTLVRHFALTVEL